MGTKTYQASEPVYISSEGRMVYPGEVFTVSDEVKPGKSWLTEDGKPLTEKKVAPAGPANAASARG